MVDLASAAESSELLHIRTLDVGSILGAKALVGYGHLYAIADVLTGPGVIFGPWTLLRSMVEGLSFGLWIMSADSVEARVQRCMTERLHGIYETRKLGNEVGVQALVDHADERIARIRQDADSLGFEFQEPDGRAPYAGEARPAAVSAARSLYDNATTGALVYRRASQYVHGMMSAVVTHLEDPPPGDDVETDMHNLQPQATAEDVALLTRVTITAAISGLGRYFEYSGYSGATWKGIAATALQESQALGQEYEADT